MNITSYTKIQTYINKNPIAILGTAGENGVPYGAAIYVCADESQPIIYFLTKQDTHKYKHIRLNPQVSLTIVNPSENSTLQAGGDAFDVADAHSIDMVMDKISREHDYAKDWLPPIAKIRAGAYAVVGIRLSRGRLAYFKDKSIGDEHIFTEL